MYWRHLQGRLNPWEGLAGGAADLRAERIGARPPGRPLAGHEIRVLDGGGPGFEVHVLVVSQTGRVQGAGELLDVLVVGGPPDLRRRR